MDPVIKTNKQIKTTKPKLIDRWIQQMNTVTKTTFKKKIDTTTKSKVADEYSNQSKLET